MKMQRDEAEWRRPPRLPAGGMFLAGALLLTPCLAAADKADHWAFKPIAHPAVPEVKDPAWCRNEIDRFVLAKLEEKGLAPSPAADRRTVLRRVYFDLTGLPPTPGEMKEFADDASADAYEKVVDKLLASPRYGERWARHWMDVAHFAETHGNDQDRERPNAWPYRDYLVRSFNGDKPYTRLIEEQVAGDVLYPDDPQATVALGFIAAGPWDESSLRDIREDSIDRKVGQNLDRDDMVMTVFSAFTSTTVGCARCHDHKFDPISQKEYYGLQADFAGVDRADRPFDPDPAIHSRRRLLLKQKQGLEMGRYVAGASPLEPAAQAQAARWEHEIARRTAVWTPLDPQTFTSSGGATLCRLDDLSIYSAGTRPDKDTYTITARTDLPKITAVRLELISDDRLPHKGPGRQDNGNLHVNEFFVKAAPASHPDDARTLDIAAAKSDFDQQGWGIGMAIDRKSDTAWGIYPQVGQSHAGVFEFKEGVEFAGGAVLTFVIEQTHGQGHLIGRFRISATSAPLPVPIDGKLLPANIAEILAAPPEKRDAAQRLTINTFYLHERIERELAALPPPQYIYAVSNGGDLLDPSKPARSPRPIFVLHRGDIAQPGEAAKPGALAFVRGLDAQFKLEDPDNEAARRAALAHWLSDARNCLTWRSIVNRAWHYHFGKGIVATPNDLGHMGTPPTHPELLDWLATWFLHHGGSLKQLHRLIVTSSTYRQSSAYNGNGARIDAADNYLWRMERSRLDAETVRDTILQDSGLLDTTMGGPSARQFLESPGIHVTPILDYAGFNVDSPAARRLSIYRFLFRTLPDPFMDAMDCPDASQFAPARNTSMTALQALAMLNDRFTVRYGEHLAERATREANDLPGQITRIYQLCFNRDPTEKELRELSAYAAKHGMANVCRVVLNSNEFMFVD